MPTSSVRAGHVGVRLGAQKSLCWTYFSSVLIQMSSQAPVFSHGVCVCCCMCCCRSSVQRVLGRPCRLCVLSLRSRVGSQCKAAVFHSWESARSTLRAYRHLRRLCRVTQSSRRSFCTRSSISCVHRLIQSTHVSRHSVGSRLGRDGLWSDVVLLMSQSLGWSPIDGACGLYV